MNVADEVRDWPKKHTSQYPWDEWFQEIHFTLIQGEDFSDETMIHAMMQMVRRNAAIRGLSVALKGEPDRIHVVVLGSTEDANPERKRGPRPGKVREVLSRD